VLSFSPSPTFRTSLYLLLCRVSSPTGQLLLRAFLDDFTLLKIHVTPRYADVSVNIMLVFEAVLDGLESNLWTRVFTDR
jgi:hypothetical protein